MEELMAARTLRARAGTSEFTATIADRAVSVRRQGDESAAEIETRYLGHGRVSLTLGDTRHVAWVVDEGDARWVFCDGEVTVVDLDEGRPRPGRRPGSPGHDTLTAPMPATVIRVVAPAGARVARGATVLLLEAMKMELPLRAPHAAVVSALHCREGDLVQPGVTLVELDEAPAE
jgi:3-methylcrotonyl-CoA carboxylase alpha subunit